MTDDELYKELNRALDTIYSEILSLRVDQYIFWEVQEIIRSNSTINIESEFYLWMGRAYAASMSVAIRRQVDRRKDTVSFFRFLDCLARHPGVITRARYKSFSTTAPEGYMDADFDRFVGPGEQTLKRSDIQKDVDTLVAHADALKQYTDSTVAHRARTAPATIPTFGDIDKAVDVLEKLLKKYLLLFRATGLASALPAFLYDWKAVFRAPWIPTGKGPPSSL